MEYKLFPKQIVATCSCTFALSVQYALFYVKHSLHPIAKTAVATANKSDDLLRTRFQQELLYAHCFCHTLLGRQYNALHTISLLVGLYPVS